MKLHNYWRSSCSWRVRIAMHHKGIPFEYVAVNLLKGEQREPGYQRLSPWTSVPTLEVDGRFITQSLAIIEFLEERYPEKPLLPRDQFMRAQVRERAELINSGIQPMQNLSTIVQLKALRADDKAFVQHFIVKGMRALEQLLQKSAGQFCVGDEVTLADVCLIPQLYGCRRFGVDTAQFPIALRIEKNCEALPAFKAAHADNQQDAVKS